jgi:hypothetical protein
MEYNDAPIHDHLSALRARQNGDDADRRLPVFLRLHRVWQAAKA